ncbi:hypothetical protein ISF_09563 [Cordyceps fumosorosea ARSEF 2679]|uniref:Uncharacterized protein n=1 Tax=Cordyceps fumosorosea (strain ARSEF 2679) TaxID=1081104 RepID=A0A167G1F4_CORFA|nr:hypothetical protein ISF_09563 [Cordyceps fumosorosea ARSEF 2679]OAA46029.1 hypothetical protein ISF_09563 [Cordyceps fumosorosea ARSEF 2679]
MQLLCAAVIRKNWVRYMHVRDIPKLVELLADNQSKLKFSTNTVPSLATTHFPRETVARDVWENSVDTTAADPGATHMPGQEITEESPGNATPTNPDATQAPGQEINRPPASISRSIVSGMPWQTKEFQVKWSRQGITACFDEQFAHVTSCAEGQKISMIFPEWAFDDCVISIPLDLFTAKSLVQVLFGIVVHLQGEAPPADNAVMVTCDGSRETVFRRQTGDAIAKALGKKLWEYTNKSRGRQLEGNKEHTDCASVSISGKHCSLSVSIGTEAATEVLKELQKGI